MSFKTWILKLTHVWNPTWWLELGFFPYEFGFDFEFNFLWKDFRLLIGPFALNISWSR